MLVQGQPGTAMSPTLECGIAIYIGLARTIHIYVYTVHIRYFLQRNPTIHTVIYGVYIRFWPTLYVYRTFLNSPQVNNVFCPLA